MSLQAGLTATISITVKEADTATALGSGEVPVLGTPRVIALAEEASVKAVAGELDDDCTSVGASVQLNHLAPTPIGMKVEAEATLAKIEGRRLTFVVRVTDERGLVAAGKITRAVVRRDRFLQKAEAPAEPTP